MVQQICQSNFYLGQAIQPEGQRGLWGQPYKQRAVAVPSEFRLRGQWGHLVIITCYMHMYMYMLTCCDVHVVSRIVNYGHDY